MKFREIQILELAPDFLWIYLHFCSFANTFEFITMIKN